MVVHRIRVGLMLTLISALVGCSFTAAAPKSLRGNLWRVVHYGCVPNQRLFGLPAPCDKVDLSGGFAVVPSLEFADELLLVPTVRLSGIEDPRLLDPQTPDYWADAWAERKNLTATGLDIPDDWVGLAINSSDTRSQDQLHIHIDCIKSSTYEALRSSHIGADWQMIEFLPSQRYWVRHLSAADFQSISLFRIVAASMGPAAMRHQTIVAVRANGADAGFYILRQTFNETPQALGFGEELLDNRCHGLRKALRTADWLSR
jgi:CDP-diacylglycerol pyrophosphatase